jgi:hypothetical protein
MEFLMAHVTVEAAGNAPAVNAAGVDYNAPAGRGKFSGFARIALVPRDCKYGRARLRGWMDYRAGRGFRSTYDEWSRRKQYAYERGRQQACLTLAARPDAPLPPWRLDETVDEVIRRHLGFAAGEAVLVATRVARARRDKGDAD